MGIQRPSLPKCPRCEKTIRAGDLFCRHCGLQLEPARSGTHGFRRVAYLAAVVVTAAVSAVVILHAVTTPLALGPTTSTRGQTATVSQPAATDSAANTSPSPTTSATASRAWSTHSVNAHGVGFSLQLPTNWIASPTSRPDYWLWTAPNGVGQVTLVVKTYRNSGATESLGPNAYGTPITTSTSGIASQQLDVKWAPQHWLWVTMKVPKSQLSRLGTIARSVNIT